jgi:hypothetical protein
MKRRKFLKTLAWGAAALPGLGLPRLGFAAKLPPYAQQLPTTPCDAPPGSWTLVVLPDTQNYSASFPETFNRQCDWIVAHRQTHNILFVAHEGDLTDNNSAPQWQNAHQAMRILNQAQMPYALVTGNHDIGHPHHIGATRFTLLNDYFKEADYASSKNFSLCEPGIMQSSWHEFDTPTGKFLLLALEYAPRDKVVDWAHQVMAAHPDHKVIFMTHAYLYCNSTRYDWAKYGKHQLWNPKASPGLVADGNANDGEDLWNKLISKYPNIFITLNGHVLLNGTGYLASPSPAGQTVHQILANYQAGVEVDDGAGGIEYRKGLKYPGPRAYRGGGFLRLMQFYPDGKTVAVKTYSPWYDRWLTAADQQFSLALG